MSGAVGALWATLVLAFAWRRRPPPDRLRRLHPSRSRARRRRTALPVLAGPLGGAVRRVLGRPADPAADRRLGRSVMFAAPVLLLWPPLAVPVGVLAWAWPAVGARRRRRRHDEAVAAALPEVVDLFALAVGAGLTVSLAVAVVGRRSSGPLAVGLRRVAEEVALGRRAADALDDLPAVVGEPVRPLVTALVASERYGAPVASGLDRLAAEVRLDRRRRAEEAARRIPVKLLFPLVLCVLPAFVLLTVAPLLAGALRSLRL